MFIVLSFRSLVSEASVNRALALRDRSIFSLFELFGETKETVSFLTELKNVAEDAITSFSRLSNLQLRIAEAQPAASYDTLGLLDQLIERTRSRIPVWERSIQEVKVEWNLP